MRYSKLLGKTHSLPRVRGFFAGADLLQQAGYLQIVGKGLIGWLPLGELVLRNLRLTLEKKIELIGGQAASWPNLPASKGGGGVFQESSDEVALEFVRSQVKSYKELPVFLYQFNRKYNLDPIAAGRYRGSEILAQKGFIFHSSFSSLNNFLPRIHSIFRKVLLECNLETLLIRDSDEPVGPDTRYSTSLLVLPRAQRGDCQFCSCEHCNYHQIIPEESPHNLIRMERDAAGRHCFCRICNRELLIRDGYVLARAQRVRCPLLERFRLQRGDNFISPLVVKTEFYLTPTLFFAAEANTRDKGLLWPRALSPYRALVLGIGSSSTARRYAEGLIQREPNLLLDDRNFSLARKMRDFYLLGIPQAVVVSAQKLQLGKVDVIDRRTETTHTIDQAAVGDFLAE